MLHWPSGMLLISVATRNFPTRRTRPCCSARLWSVTLGTSTIFSGKDRNRNSLGNKTIAGENDRLRFRRQLVSRVQSHRCSAEIFLSHGHRCPGRTRIDGEAAREVDPANVVDLVLHYGDCPLVAVE